MATSFARVLVSIINGRGLNLRNAPIRPETAAIARRGAARWATCASPELRLVSPGVVVCRLASWRRESPPDEALNCMQRVVETCRNPPPSPVIPAASRHCHRRYRGVSCWPTVESFGRGGIPRFFRRLS
ncbi:hypothetical protein F5144DRAFT_229478 [Chaetomium tenue]|uniref:Uncharacterized protein n=1 Tax=Chaetomium tenue TaxID=1854479 RepID=A0ACB7P8A2_9PEZI|nr:hypothetical protein F5144DRAFT_229478 [Chaetomium globosum]